MASPILRISSPPPPRPCNRTIVVLAVFGPELGPVFTILQLSYLGTLLTLGGAATRLRGLSTWHPAAGPRPALDDGAATPSAR